MDIRLGVYQRSRHCSFRSLYLADQSVDTDITLPLLRGDLLVALQPVEEPAVAVRLLLILGRKIFKVIFQFLEALLQRIDAVADHLQGGRRSQLGNNGLYKPVGIPHGLQVGDGHLHAVVAQNPGSPAVLLRGLHAQILQDLINVGKCLFNGVAQITPGSSHQGLISLLRFLISLLKHTAFIVELFQRGVALTLCKEAQHIRRQTRQLVGHRVHAAVIMIFVDGSRIPGEVLVSQLVLRLFQSLDQLLHGRRVNRKTSLEQFDIDFRRHAQSDLLQLPPGCDIPHISLPQLAAVVILGDGSRFFI